MARSLRVRAILIPLVLLASACGDDDEAPPGDAGVDATPGDAGLDAGGDAGTDAGVARLDPTTIPQFATPLVIPPAMTPTATPAGRTDYRIAVRQIEQQVLPEGMPPTTVWAYGSADDDASFHYPAFTIEARTGSPIRVEWINELVDASGALATTSITR